MSENSSPSIRFKNLPLDKAAEMIRSAGEPEFRTRQVVKWVYQKRVDSFGAMTNVSKTTRRKLAGIFTIEKLILAAVVPSPCGDAVKFGFELRDTSRIIESVLLIDGDRHTACLSSQLGCGLGCSFCETGHLGLIRNLTQEEIIGQLIGIDDYCAERGDRLVTNIVFMGMGEALSNFDAFRASLAIIMDDDCFAIGGRRITVSTAGVIPSIERFMEENLNIGLAISLNDFSNERRSAVMPINKKFPIETLTAIAVRYFEKTGRRVTFEYIVIPGETDTEEAAQGLRRLLGSLTCKINLIPLNPTRGAVVPPSQAEMVRFAKALRHLGLSATIRTSRGSDIGGACGQLTAHEYPRVVAATAMPAQGNTLRPAVLTLTNK
jgi:23S rRNA (adenine2503-C2)-methyltransferase